MPILVRASILPTIRAYRREAGWKACTTTRTSRFEVPRRNVPSSSNSTKNSANTELNHHRKPRIYRVWVSFGIGVGSGLVAPQPARSATPAPYLYGVVVVWASSLHSFRRRQNMELSRAFNAPSLEGAPNPACCAGLSWGSPSGCEAGQDVVV